MENIHSDVGVKRFKQVHNLSILWQTNFFFDLQEHFLVPDHTITDITGASFAGFYYVCLQKSAATIEGYYYHRSSEWLVQLFLYSYCAWHCICSCILDNEKTETQLVKASQKGAFYFLFPECLLLRLDLMSAWFSRLISKHVCSWVYILLYFCLTLFCDWSRLAVPSFEPIKCKTTTKYNLVASSTVGSLVGFMLSSHCPKEHFCFLWLLLFWFFNTV